MADLMVTGLYILSGVVRASLWTYGAILGWRARNWWMVAGFVSALVSSIVTSLVALDLGLPFFFVYVFPVTLPLISAPCFVIGYRVSVQRHKGAEQALAELVRKAARPAP